MTSTDYDHIWDRPMRHPFLVAVVTVVGGYLSILVVYQLCPAPNNRVHHMFDYVLNVPVSILAFLIGAFIGAGFVWMMSKDDEIYIPWRVVAGAAGGWVLGLIVFIILRSSFHSTSAFQLHFYVLSVLFSVLVAYSQTGKRELNPERIYKVITLLLSLLVLFALLWAYMDIVYFPKNGTREKRQAWAIRTLGEPYQNALNFIRSNDQFSKDVGWNMTIAPAREGQTLVVSDWLDTGYDVFTFDLVGKNGRGILQYYCDHPCGEARGQWNFNGREIPVYFPERK